MPVQNRGSDLDLASYARDRGARYMMQLMVSEAASSVFFDSLYSSRKVAVFVTVDPLKLLKL